MSAGAWLTKVPAVYSAADHWPAVAADRKKIAGNCPDPAHPIK